MLVQSIRDWFARRASRAELSASLGPSLAGARVAVVVLLLVGGAGYGLYRNSPLQTVGAGQVGVRANRLTGNVDEWREGSVLVLPGLHELRVYSLRDRTYRPAQISRAEGPAPLQSVEGLSLGVDLAFR
jgi:hypothetical protein